MKFLGDRALLMPLRQDPVLRGHLVLCAVELPRRGFDGVSPGHGDHHRAGRGRADVIEGVRNSEVVQQDSFVGTYRMGEVECLAT
jgi:hypothetical protein